MEHIDTILKVIPILVLVAGFLRYLSSEIAKRKERRVHQLLELRSQIQDDNDISHLMFLCETDSLTSDFYSYDDSEINEKLYKEVVKTIGLFDTVCYAFIHRNLDKNVFLYFYGEMKEIISNHAIDKYLDHLLVRNTQSMDKDHIDKDMLFDVLLPYGYFQLCMKTSLITLTVSSQRKISKLIRSSKSNINESIYKRFFLKAN